MGDTVASPFLVNTLTFTRGLRQAGLPLSLDQVLRFVRALEWIDLGSREQLFHTARALLVTRREDLELFTRLFERFWSAPAPGGRPRKMPRAPRHEEQRRRPFTVVDYMAYKARRFDPAIEVRDRAGTFTGEETLRHRDFSELTGEELAAVRRLIASLEWRACLRRTRRRRPDARGSELDARSALRRAARTGGVALELPRRERRYRRRPLVLLADVSGSMEKLSRLVLQFAYGVSRALGEVEAFAFGTRLTRLTPALRLRNVDRAIDEAARAVVDWHGGTRIGECLGEFNRRWGRRVLRRGAVVLILSDGWERGGVDRLRREVRHLRRHCHRLIWLNPLAGRAGYRPLVEGMAAALPLVDDFLPLHDLASLEALAEHLRALPARRRGAALGRAGAGPAMPERTSSTRSP